MLRLREQVAQTVKTTDTHPHLVPTGEWLPGQTTTWGCLATSAVFPALRHAYLAYKNHAYSYRDFRVGAAACVVSREQRGTTEQTFVSGVNVKTNPDDTDDIHAEGMVLNRIREIGHKVVGVPLLAVVGDLQPDQQTGLATPTLHPCGKCRDILLDNRELFANTVIVTATPTLDTLQTFSLGELRSYHAGQISELETFRLHIPLQFPDENTISAMESSAEAPEDAADERTLLALQLSVLTQGDQLAGAIQPH